MTVNKSSSREIRVDARSRFSQTGKQKKCNQHGIMFIIYALYALFYFNIASCFTKHNVYFTTSSRGDWHPFAAAQDCLPNELCSKQRACLNAALNEPEAEIQRPRSGGMARTCPPRTLLPPHPAPTVLGPAVLSDALSDALSIPPAPPRRCGHAAAPQPWQSIMSQGGCAGVLHSWGVLRGSWSADLPPQELQLFPSSAVLTQAPAALSPVVSPKWFSFHAPQAKRGSTSLLASSL